MGVSAYYWSPGPPVPRYPSPPVPLYIGTINVKLKLGIITGGLGDQGTGGPGDRGTGGPVVGRDPWFVKFCGYF